jgi:hypothetical protein
MSTGQGERSKGSTLTRGATMPKAQGAISTVSLMAALYRETPYVSVKASWA